MGNLQFLLAHTCSNVVSLCLAADPHGRIPARGPWCLRGFAMGKRSLRTCLLALALALSVVALTGPESVGASAGAQATGYTMLVPSQASGPLIAAAGANCGADGTAPQQSIFRRLTYQTYTWCVGSGVPPPTSIQAWTCLNHHIFLWIWSGDEYCGHRTNYNSWSVKALMYEQPVPPGEYRNHGTGLWQPPPGYGCGSSNCNSQFWDGDTQVN
jgi:hypothetical protein